MLRLSRLPFLAALVALATAALTLSLAAPASATNHRWDDPISITFPVNGPVDYTNDYHSPRSRGAHGGTDLGRADAYGLPIHAAMGGTINFITGLDNRPPSYGYMIDIAGDDGRRYSYVHLGRQAGPATEAYAPGLRKGSRVERGQHIGYLGHSGNASPSWPHLHFEIHDTKVRDPYGDHRRNPYPSLVDAQRRGDVPGHRPASIPAGATPVPGDWNGDGASQPGWFHDGVWYLTVRPGTVTTFRYGRAGDQPVSGDWNGSTRDGIGVFRDGVWYLRNELSKGASWRHFRYGRAGDQAVTGDWNRTNRDGVGLFRDGTWYVRNDLSRGASWRHFRYGRAGDIAISGDWQNLGRDGVGVVRDGYWYVRSHLNGGASTFHYPFGRPTDTPVTGDWDGDGDDSSGIVRGSQWRLSNNMPASAPDVTWR